MSSFLLSKAIGIHILNFTSIPESDKYHNVFHVIEKDNGAHYFKDLELHTIELKKFTDHVSNQLSDVVAKIKTSLDIWAAFLTKYNLFDKDNLPESLKNTGLKKALTVLEAMNFSEDEKEGYDDHLKWLRIQINTIKKYEQSAKEEGFSEGKAESKAEIAINMLNNNETIDKIMRFTGLSKEHILKFKKTTRIKK